MSPPASETAEAPHPRMTNGLVGHALAEAALLAAYRSGRVPHAFLFVGAKGIGKATLAYRLARFVLAHPDPTTAEVQAATSLAVDPSHPVARRIAARTHADLLVLERTPNDKGVTRQQIAVEDVYRTVSFFGSTAGEGGWRIAIVDSVDELNRFGANAEVGAVLAAAMESSVDDAEIGAAAAAADGSVARALAFLDEDALALGQQALKVLDALPTLDANELHALGDAIAGTDPQRLAAFIDTINAWLAQRLDRNADEIARLARLAEAWERINAAARDAAEYNLDRKPLVFSVFGLLAEATRG
jgi:DNA polymerase-3 subunit delta'